MSSPHVIVPRFQLNDPTTTLDALNCNPTAGAMLLDRDSVGRVRVFGGDVRRLTGDTTGGTTLLQIRDAIRKGWNVEFNTRIGAPIEWVWGSLRHHDRGVSLSGSSAATRGTRYQASATFGGNHQWYIAEGRGWRLVGGVWRPDEVLLYDPLADGRLHALQRIIKSPFWIPRRYVEAFAEQLDLGSRLLGPGRAYAMVSRDTEPHVHFRFGTTEAAQPFPVTFPTKPNYAVRPGPARSYGLIGRTQDIAPTFVVHQVKRNGEPLDGNSVWYGDHDGAQWIHASARRIR